MQWIPGKELVVVISDGLGKTTYKKSRFFVSRISQKMSLKQVEQGFSSFFAQIFGIFHVFSEEPYEQSALKDHQI